MKDNVVNKVIGLGYQELNNSLEGCTQLQSFREYLTKKKYNVLSNEKEYSSLDDLENDQKFFNNFEGIVTIFVDGVKVTFFSNMICSSNKLVISFNGARNPVNYKKSFPRWSYSNLIDASLLVFDDPLYEEFPNLRLGWFYGTKDKNYYEIIQKIIKTIQTVSKIENEDVFFYASSGGGTVALQLSHLIKGSCSISLNPQIDLAFYDRKILNGDFSQCLDINLEDFDKFSRNVFYSLLNDSSFHIVMVNIQCKNDFDVHLKKLCEFLSIDFQFHYGLNIFKNIIIWVYDCVGVPSPHNSVEIPIMFPFILDIAKTLKCSKYDEQKLTSRIIFINELFNSYYVLKRKIFSTKIVIFDNCENVVGIEKNEEKILKNFEVKPNIDIGYNFGTVINELDKNSLYSIELFETRVQNEDKDFYDKDISFSIYDEEFCCTNKHIKKKD